MNRCGFRHGWQWLAALLLLAGTATGRAASESLKVGRQVMLPELGLRFRVLDDCVAKPLPTIDRINNNGRELYQPRAWWIHDQHVGVWGGPGCEIVVAKVTRRAPDLGNQLPATAEACEKASSGEGSWTEKDFDRWVENFTGVKPSGKAPDGKFYTDRKVVRYSFADKPNEPVRVGFLVNSTREAGRRLFFYYLFAPQYKRSRSIRAVEQSVASAELLSIALYGEKNDSKAYDRLGGRRPKNETPEYQRSRRQVIDNIRNYRDWWYLETENFIIVSNLTDRRNIRIYSEALERSRRAYEAYFPIRTPLKAVSTVRLFNKRQDYINYVGAMGPATIGVWMPGKLELAVSPLDHVSRDQRQTLMENTIHHEGFHQYLHFACGEAENAPWFNEGTAEYFEGLESRDGRNRVRNVDERLPAVRRALAAGRPDFAAMFRKTLAEFYEPAKVQDNYALAGALIYYLFKGAPVTGHPEYAGIPQRYYEALLKTRDWRKATAEAWQGIDLEKFTDHFVDFWNNDGDSRRAENYDPLGAR